MKTIIRYVAFTIAGLFLYMNSDAQVKFGLKAGMNYSTMYDEKAPIGFNAKPKAGFAGGGFVDIPIIPFIGVQPELMFSQKGYRASGDNYDYTLTTNHLDIPLLLKLKPLPFLHIVGGPMYSYTLSREDKFTTGSRSVIQQQDIDNSNLRKNTLAAIGGLDVNISKIVLSGRAGWDLTNNNGDGTSTEPRYKNFFGQATIGVRF